MAIAFDAATSSDSITPFNHTPVGTPKGVLVLVCGADDTSLSTLTAVTYGIASLTEVSGSPNTKTTGRDYRVWAFFLGTSVPTGTQSVALVGTITAAGYQAVCITYTATGDTAVEGVNTSINSDSSANPSSTLTIANESHISIGFSSGQGAVTGITPLTGWTSIAETDQGLDVTGVYRKDANASSNTTVGWTQTAEDALAIAVAVREAAGAATSFLLRRQRMGVGM